MNEFRNWFARMMYGRYGNDELNRVLLFVGLIFVVIGLFAFRRYMNILVLIVLAICYFRMFSRNIYKRQQELNAYLRFKSRFTSRTSPKGGVYGSNGGFSTSGNDGKRVLICPYCKGKLRVPVGAGKIKVQCPHCKRTFEEVV